jgi:hypothetical protein
MTVPTNVTAAQEALVAAVAPDPEWHFHERVVGRVWEAAKTISRDHPYDDLLCAYVELRKRQPPPSSRVKNSTLDRICSLLTEVTAVHAKPDDVALAFQRLVDERPTSGLTLCAELAWLGCCDGPRDRSVINPRPRFVRPELFKDSALGLVKEPLYAELSKFAGRITDRFHSENFVPPTRVQYLRDQLVSHQLLRPRFTMHQADLASVLVLDWAGTLPELIETVTTLCPGEAPRRRLFHHRT